MARNQRHLIELFGCPIEILGISKSGLQKRLFAPIVRCRKKPCLTVQFVRTIRGFRAKGFAPQSNEKLLGDGFALEYASRTMYFSSSEKFLSHAVKGQRGHPLLSRAALFSTALLREVSGSSRHNDFLYLHASAVATRKGALVFCGESTFGKSTISGKLLYNFPKLEDDQVIIRMDRRPQIVVFSPRLRKKSIEMRTNSPRTLPIVGIFWLRKSADFAITPVDGASISSRILMPMVNWSNPQAVTQRLTMLRQLTQNIPCAELSFAKKTDPLVDLLKTHDFV